jgi:uncharacterized UBP type Zn finger protein
MRMNNPTQEVSPQMVAELVSMGFNEDRSRRALKYFRNNLSLATEHLINTPPELDDSVLGPIVQPGQPQV